MTETTAFGYQEDPHITDHVHAPPGPPLQGFPKFSPEELRVLGECNQESFFQRSLPLGVAMGMTTFIAMQKGHMKPNPRFGVFPKVTLAVVMGYFIGKLSYQEACAEKLMALPGSYIGQLLRERKEGRGPGTGTQKKSPTMYGAGPSDIYSDAGPGSALDLDTDRPAFNDNDTYRQDAGQSINPSEPPPPTRPTLSYDELRRLNRGDYSKQDPYKVDPGAMPPISRRPPPPPQSAHTNKYGDDMD